MADKFEPRLGRACRRGEGVFSLQLAERSIVALAPHIALIEPAAARKLFCFSTCHQQNSLLNSSNQTAIFLSKMSALQDSESNRLSQHHVISKPESVPLITASMLRSLITIDLAIAAVEQAFVCYGRERQVLSEPPALLLPARTAAEAAFKIKGGRLASLGAAGFRVIADKITGEAEQTIDYCWVANLWTGQLIGLVDETSLHRVRTAVTGIVAAKWLARPDSRIVAIIGAGKIADELLAPLCRTFDVHEIRVVARSPKSARSFAERHAGVANVTPLSSVSEATKGADIVICISSSSVPVLRAINVAPGMFICGLGGGSEIAVDVLDRADRFVVDDFEYALSIGSVRGWVEQGMKRERISRRVDADIGEITIGAKQGRRSDTDIVLAVIQGMAICDLALAHLALSRAGLISTP